MEPILEVAGVEVAEDAGVDAVDDGATEVSSEDGATEVSSEDGTTEVSSEEGTVEVSDEAVDSTEEVVDTTDGVEDAGVEDSGVVQAANMVITMTNASKTTSAFLFMRIVLLSKLEALMPLWYTILTHFINK